jgi:hypothetical protein
LPCQSHYWIIKNQLKWAEAWFDQKISDARKKDQKANEKYQKGQRIKIS